MIIFEIIEENFPFCNDKKISDLDLDDQYEFIEFQKFIINEKKKPTFNNEINELIKKDKKLKKLIEIMNKCIQFDSKYRYNNFNELLKEIEKLIE